MRTGGRGPGIPGSLVLLSSPGPLGLSLPCVPPSILLSPSLMHTLTVCLLSFALQFSPELSQNSHAVDFSGTLYSLKFLVPLPRAPSLVRPCGCPRRGSACPEPAPACSLDLWNLGQSLLATEMEMWGNWLVSAEGAMVSQRTPVTRAEDARGQVPGAGRRGRRSLQFKGASAWLPSVASASCYRHGPAGQPFVQGDSSKPFLP